MSVPKYVCLEICVTWLYGESQGPKILEAKRHHCITGEFSTRLRSVTSSGRRAKTRSERSGKGLAEQDGCVDETEAVAAAAAAAEVVDGGGVCRDKYLPVNTERLALPSRSIPVRAANDMHSRGWNA